MTSVNMSPVEMLIAKKTSVSNAPVRDLQLWNMEIIIIDLIVSSIMLMMTQRKVLSLNVKNARFLDPNVPSLLLSKMDLSLKRNGLNYFDLSLL